MVEQLEKDIAKLKEKIEEFDHIISAVLALSMTTHDELEEQKKRFDMLGETNSALVSALKMLSKE